MKKSLRTALLFAVLCAGVAAGGESPAPRVTKPVGVLVPGERHTADLPAATAQLIAATNAARLQEGRAALAMNPQLAAAAAEFARFMAGTDRYGHDADGRQPSDRAIAQGYEPCIVAENLAYQYLSTGFATADLADSLLAGWLDSPGHRANLLDPDVTEMGIAIARDSRSGKYYAVQVFGRPKALQLVFALRNDAGVDVRYEFDRQSASLPAGTTATHRLCRPAEVTIRWPGRQPPARITAGNGRLYVVTRARDGAFALTTNASVPSP